MVQKTKAVGKGNGTAAPFIYLSDVLRDYGAYIVSTEGNGQGTQTQHGDLDQASTDFGLFLADKIESTEILLFDVHTLTLISGLEMGEVLQYLRSRRSSEPTDIGIEKGRDYCLDGERTMQAIAKINAPAPARQPRNRKSSQRNANSSVVSPNSGAVRNTIEEEWFIERKLISVDDMLLTIITARKAAKREKDFPSVLAARAAARKPASQLPDGAMALLKKPSEFSNYVYSAIKFNRNGLPALSLDAVAPESPSGALWLIERTAKWQSLLKDMHQADPEKSHTQLCDELAIRLNAERGLREKKLVSSSTIRRLTKPLGNKTRGGSIPKRFRK